MAWREKDPSVTDARRWAAVAALLHDSKLDDSSTATTIFGHCACVSVTASSDHVPMLSVVELLGQCYVATKLEFKVGVPERAPG
jgi:hypothetical protein